MLQQLFGAELDLPVRLAISLIVIAALLGITVLVMRKLSGGLPGRASGRGRSGPRLAIVDAISIDPRRRLVLVRRDDVEHLLLTGGTNDVVVEQNITGNQAAAPAGQRRAAPLEHDMQRNVAPPPAPPAHQPAQADRGRLPPAAARPDALAASAVAAALAAPTEKDLAPPAAPAPGAGAKPVPAEPAPVAPAGRRPTVAKPQPAVAKPQLPPAEIATPAPTPAAEEKSPEDRLQDVLAATEQSKRRLEGLRKRHAAAPEEEKQALQDQIKRFERRVNLLTREARQITAETESAKVAPSTEQPQLSEAAAKRGLALLLGTEPPALPPTEAPQTTPSPSPKQGNEAEAAPAAEKAAAAEKATAERAAAQKAAAEKAAAEKVAAERAAAEKAAAENAAAERAAAQRAAAERAAAEKAAAEKAAAERAAAQRAAAEKAAAEKAAAERAAAQRAAAEKAAAEKAAAELADQIAAEMAAALQNHEAAPHVPPVEPAARPAPARRVSEEAAAEPRLREMAQRLDAALAHPTDDKLRLSLSDLLEDLEGAATDINVPAAPERPRIPVAPRRPVEPTVEPKNRPALNQTDYARFLSGEAATPVEKKETGETAARTQARELFSNGLLRATRRLERTAEPPLAAPTITTKAPSHPTEPPAPVGREPLLTARRSEPAPLLDVLPPMQVEPPSRAEEKTRDKKADDTDAFLDEFDAEMASLLGRTPPR